MTDAENLPFVERSSHLRILQNKPTFEGAVCTPRDPFHLKDLSRIYSIRWIVKYGIRGQLYRSIQSGATKSRLVEVFTHAKKNTVLHFLNFGPYDIPIVPIPPERISKLLMSGMVSQSKGTAPDDIAWSI